MPSLLRGLIAAAIVFLLASDADACSRCRRYGSSCSYYRPVYVAPTPIVRNYPVTTNSVSYVYNISQLPATQGSTQFGLQAQFASYNQTDLAIPAMVALAHRNSDASVQIAGIAGQAQQLAAGNQAQALANNSQALRIAEIQATAQAGERYLAQIRAISPPGGAGAALYSVLNQQVYNTPAGSNGYGANGYGANGHANGNGYQAQQQPQGLLGQFCLNCHGTNLPQPKGNFYLGGDQQTAGQMRARFFDIVQRLSKKQMPPPEAPQPTDAQRVQLVNEVEAIITAYPTGVSVQGSSPPPDPAPAPPAPIQPMGGW